MVQWRAVDYRRLPMCRKDVREVLKLVGHPTHLIEARRCLTGGEFVGSLSAVKALASRRETASASSFGTKT